MIFGIYEECDCRDLRNKLRQQLEPLCRQFGGDHAEAGKISARSCEAGDHAVLNRVAAGDKYDRNCRACAMCGSDRDITAHGGDHANLSASEVGSQSWESIKLSLCLTIFDYDILTLVKPNLSQSLIERGHKRRVRTRCGDT